MTLQISCVLKPFFQVAFRLPHQHNRPGVSLPHNSFLRYFT